MEQHIGHRTYYENLRRFVDTDPQIKASWVEITYHDPDSIWARLPGLPKGLRGTLMGRQQVRRALRQSDHEVAVFNTQVPAALAGSLARKKPYILCTDVTPLQYDRMGIHIGHRPDSSSLIRRYKHSVNVRLFQEAAYLLPWSTWTADSMKNEYGLDPARIEVLPPGVDTSVWRPAPKPEGQGPVRILFIGGDFYPKGGGLLLEAFRSLPEGTAELVLVTRSALEPAPGIHVHNNMKPNTPELIALAQSCDLFVLPTVAEAFGIAAIEASAVGLPVITTQLGGLKDVVIEGQTGFLIPAQDGAALSDRLNRILSDPDLRLRMGQTARAHVEANFDARKNVGRLIEIVRNSVKQN